MLEGFYDDGDEIDATELTPFSKWQDLLRQSTWNPVRSNEITSMLGILNQDQ